LVAEGSIVAVSGIGHDHATRHAVRDGLADLAEGDLRFGLKPDLSRHTRLLAPGWVLGPVFRQVEAVGNGPAGLLVGHRQAHGDLAVGLFVELTAVLMGDTDRVLAFFRHPGIIDDPGLQGTVLLEGGQRGVTDGGQHGRILPVSVSHQVMAEHASQAVKVLLKPLLTRSGGGRNCWRQPL
jgi:hypothetical protein